MRAMQSLSVGIAFAANANGLFYECENSVHALGSQRPSPGNQVLATGMRPILMKPVAGCSWAADSKCDHSIDQST